MIAYKGNFSQNHTGIYVVSDSVPLFGILPKTVLYVVLCVFNHEKGL